MTTVAKPIPVTGAHFYDKNGVPCHFVPKKDGTGDRPANIADAWKNNWFPGVTNVLKILDKPALTNWLVEQGVLAVLTTPRLPGEKDDEFVFRVLHTEKQQEQESEKARDLGTEIHESLELALNGEPYSNHLAVYINPVLNIVKQFGPVVATEQIVVGKGYAGKLDLLAGEPAIFTVCDFKTTKTLPKKAESYPEHKLQLSAYAAALQDQRPDAKLIKTANVYISTTQPGFIMLCEQTDWLDTYTNGFSPLFQVWQWMNRYRPAL